MPALSWSNAAHVLRCTGFGTTGTAVDAVAGRDAAELVQAVVGHDDTTDAGVLSTPPPDLAALPLNDRSLSGKQRQQQSAKYAQQREDITHWWYSRILSVEQPFVERLTFAWHGIFATSMEKVRRAPFMLRQNETLRTGSRGDFLELATSMLKDPALLFWLDGPRNRRDNPNENLAREAMELFMLGHGDGYTEDDVHQAAKALTGWSLDKVKVEAVFTPSMFADGNKTILGVTKNFDTDSFCQLLAAQKASAPFVLGRLWAQLVSDTPLPDDVRSAAVSAYGSNRDIAAALVAMLTAPGFTAAVGSRVVSPIEWTFGLARTLKVSPTDGSVLAWIDETLAGLGQQPFYPPSVGGWPGGPAWLSTAAAMTRGRAAELIVAKGDVSSVSDAGTADRLDAVAHLLGLAGWSARTRAALQPLVDNPPVLVAMAANAPEYLTV